MKPSFSCVSCLSEQRDSQGNVIHDLGCEHMDVTGAPFELPGYLTVTLLVATPPLAVLDMQGSHVGNTVAQSFPINLSRCNTCAALVQRIDEHVHSQSHTRLKKALYELQRRTNKIRKRITR